MPPIVKRILISVGIAALFWVGRVGWKIATIEADDTTQDGHPANEVFWQLPDDSSLDVRVDPWPPNNGRARLLVNASLGDWSETNLTRTVSYRFGSAAAWTAMTAGPTTPDGDKIFTSDVIVPTGAHNIQFKVVQSGTAGTSTLTDWTLQVP